MPRNDFDRTTLTAALDQLLPLVEKPTRYLGGEVNSRAIDPDSIQLSVALAFPDLYEIGMSHLGFRILYGLLNEIPGVGAERAFMPWTDMLALLRERELPLTTLETRRPLAAFDLVGFSLQYELAATNVLAMLDRGGLPLLAAERRGTDPLVLGGGPAAFNPEPFAPFFDLILLGDAEEAFPELIQRFRRLQAEGALRPEIIAALAQIPGWYAPGLYDAVPEARTGMLLPRPKPGSGAPATVRRRVVFDLDRFPFPAEIVVPHAEIVHDRISWEVMRGCPVGCRFCQAGYIYRPTRERDPDEVRDGVRRSVEATGYDEFSLTSLNSGRYPALEPLLTALMDEMEPRHVSVGLSSLHASTLTDQLVEQVRRVRKTGFTMAPEAGSQRLRDVINKNLDEEAILSAARRIFSAGWDLLKLYFMIGLPTETDADIDAIVDLAGRIAAIGRELKGPRAKVTLSASTFVPKPFTPFQWFGMDPEPVFIAKQQRIRDRLPRGVQFKHHDHRVSWLEGVLSRADRSFAPAILEAYRRGAILDGWTECFNADLWRGVFRELGLDADGWASRPLPLDVELPWEIIDPLVRRSWLEREFLRAGTGATTPVCGREACAGCAEFAKECVSGAVAAGHGRMPSAPAAAFEEPPSTPPDSSTPQDGAARQDSAVEGPVPVPPKPVYRFRARFEKLGRSRFLGHLDLVRALTMAFRRAGIELAYTQGFKPHPKIAFSPALALGIGSQAEYLDFDTRMPFDVARDLPEINRTLPEGVRLTAVVPIPLTAGALQDVISRARFSVRVPGGIGAEIAERARAFLAAESWCVLRRRKGQEKEVDIRPLVAGIELFEDRLEFTLKLSVQGSARPAEVLELLFGGEPGPGLTVTRLELLAESNGRFLSPLLAGSGRPLG